MNKRLLVCSTDLMMIQFLVPHIRYLSQNGYTIDLACSEVGNRMDEVRESLTDYTESIHTVRLHRSPLALGNLLGYGDLKRIMDAGRYDLIWTNEPVMGVMSRLAARNVRRKGTKVLYMVHGFHFYKGAPLFNWLVFYPIEKGLVGATDEIVTINREDYARAKSMGFRKVDYIHGVGINTSRLHKNEEQTDIRHELGLESSTFLVLSVGELNRNKNQSTILCAIAQIHDVRVHYLVCGKGAELDNLKKLAHELGIEDRVHFLGYRMDVVDICYQADVFAMPSHREGLPVASLEAMYCGLPLVTSGVRGLADIMENGVTGFVCDTEDAAAFADAIEKLKEDPELRKRIAEHNREAVKLFGVDSTIHEAESILSFSDKPD